MSATVEAMFIYLDDLRESGEVNMFHARSLLMEMFDIPPKRAARILADWMNVNRVQKSAALKGRADE